MDLRQHIKKRPTFATTEKIQRLVKVSLWFTTMFDISEMKLPHVIFGVYFSFELNRQKAESPWWLDFIMRVMRNPF